VSNPLRRRLLQIYLHVEDYRLAEARRELLALLEEPALVELAQAETAPLSRDAISGAVSRLLKDDA
jgi:hypothetical protein